MRISLDLSDEAVIAELGQRLARQRLERGLTQARLAREAGISKRTVERIEAGGSVQLSSLVRVLRALGLLPGLEALAPEPAPSPLELLRRRGKARQRAPSEPPDADEPQEWSWGDET